MEPQAWVHPDEEEPLLEGQDVEDSLQANGVNGHAPAAQKARHHHRCHWLQTTATLLSLQLGWGLWLFPSDYARLGWLPAAGIQVLIALLTGYSGSVFTRLYGMVPNSAIMGDIGERAAGQRGRLLVYAVIYTLDATRCIILHLAATQSLAHVFEAGAAPVLWKCGLWVALPALLLCQVRALSKLTWLFMLGTGGQLVAIAIVCAKLLATPDPAARTQLVGTSADWNARVVAVMNMIFAYGGQFAFVEIIAAMKSPTHFTRAVSVCTVSMSLLYAALGAVGYWSRGDDVAEIVIFSLGTDAISRAAAACILVQAMAQYVVNLNVWSHNLLVLIGRRLKWAGAADARVAQHHDRASWFAATAFVIAYSFLISMTVPYFSSLVGLVAGGTYLLCAYVLPCWFLLRLQHGTLPRWEVALCCALIPAALLGSVLGLGSSIVDIIGNIRAGGGGGFGPEGR